MLAPMNNLVVRGNRFWRRFTILDPPCDLPVSDRGVVLTFDDGPVAQGDITLRLLETLAKEQVTACFCVIGSLAEKRPKLLEAIHSAGHCIVNHGYQHIPPLFQRMPAIADEIARTDAVIASLTGRGARWFRPPGGLISQRQREFVRSLGKHTLPLSFFALDTETKSHSAEGLVARSIKQVSADGRGVLVFHEQKFLNREESEPRHWLPQAVTEFIRHAKAAGLHFTTPDLVENRPERNHSLRRENPRLSASP